MSQTPPDFKLDLEEDSVSNTSGMVWSECSMLVLYFVAGCAYQRQFELGNEGGRGLHPM